MLIQFQKSTRRDPFNLIPKHIIQLIATLQYSGLQTFTEPLNNANSIFFIQCIFVAIYMSAFLVVYSLVFAKHKRYNQN